MSCGKHCFSEKGARTALNKAKRSKRQRRREKRFYYCHDCNAYHLTSLESADFEFYLHTGDVHSTTLMKGV